MIRYQDWPKRLEDYLHAVDGRHFEWGQFDCAQFVNGAIRAITGEDALARLGIASIASYATAEAAYAQFADGNTAPAAAFARAVKDAAKKLGLEEVLPFFAQRGDVVLVSGVATNHGPALGIVGMRGHPVCIGDGDELVEIPITFITHAWRI